MCTFINKIVKKGGRLRISDCGRYNDLKMGQTFHKCQYRCTKVIWCTFQLLSIHDIGRSRDKNLKNYGTLIYAEARKVSQAMWSFGLAFDLEFVGQIPKWPSALQHILFRCELSYSISSIEIREGVKLVGAVFYCADAMACWWVCWLSLIFWPYFSEIHRLQGSWHVTCCSAVLDTNRKTPLRHAMVNV